MEENEFVENDIVEKKPARRMKQVFIAGGNYNEPSKFATTVNRNIKILMDSDRNCDILDIKFNVSNNPRYIDYGMVYLAFILAEVDIIEEEPEDLGRKHKKKHKNK